MRFLSLAILAFISLNSTAGEPKGLLETLNKHRYLAPTIPDNGDLNPYAVVVVPATVGSLEKDDILVDNFNNINNLQGTGTTIVRYRSSIKEMKLFAQLPQKLSDCPGGVGLTTAMTVLKSGWVIVGSTPSTDGTTRTKGDGCLLVIDANGKHVGTWRGPNINAPWGNMVTIDNGDKVILFVSMAGFGVTSPYIIDPNTKYPPIVNQAILLRLELEIPEGKPPVIVKETIIGNGFSARGDIANFLLGPTGLALGGDDTLYVTDGLDNEITAIPNASTRTDSAGKGKLVTKDGLLSWPLAMVMTKQGHLIVNNGKNGQSVEIDPIQGKQIYAHWMNSNQAQSPPGNGNLFGLALSPDGKALYYVEDDINSLRIATP